MNKIPVGQTIAFGYAFLITEFWTVLRICRIPALLFVAVDYLGRRYMLFYSTGEAMLINFVAMLSVIFILFLTSSVMLVGVTRAAMGLPLNSTNYYFPLGSNEWRMLGVYFQYVLAVLGMFFLAILVGTLALALAGFDFLQVADAQPPGVAVLVLLIAAGCVCIVAFRLAFFLPAVVVAENSGLARAYNFAAGNLWRLLIVLMAIGGPILIISTIFQTGIVFSTFEQGALAGGATTVMDILEVGAATRPLLWGAYLFVYNIVIMGIIPSAAAFAYMKLKEGTGDRPNVVTQPPRG
jgi:hypothetical protein